MPWLGKTALARALKVSRPTLDGYLNRREPPPPAPNSSRQYDRDAVSAYIAAVRQAEGETKTLSQLRAEKLRMDMEAAREEQARTRGQYVHIDEARKTIEALMVELGGLLRQKFEYELPARYVGKDAVECAALNATAVDTIVLRFRQGMGKLT